MRIIDFSPEMLHKLEQISQLNMLKQFVDGEVITLGQRKRLFRNGLLEYSRNCDQTNDLVLTEKAKELLVAPEIEL